MADVTLNLDGMSCGSCVGRIEKVLSGLPRVERVAVNLATETAVVD